MKFVIVVALIGVLAALASAGFFMLRKSDDSKDGEHRERAGHALVAVRVGLSIVLFLFILLSWMMGWISPSGIPTGR